MEIPKYCRGCIFGESIGGREIRMNIGDPKRKIPLGVIVPPKVERNCLNFIDRYVRKMKPKVPFSAQCVKPEKYSPKPDNASEKSV